MSKMNYSIDLNKNIIYCHFTGDFSADKVISNIQVIRSDPNFHTDLNTIADFRYANLSKGFSEMEKVEEFVRDTTIHRERFKLALHTDELNESGPKLYATISGFLSAYHVKVFHNLKEAEAWVAC